MADRIRTPGSSWATDRPSKNGEAKMATITGTIPHGVPPERLVEALARFGEDRPKRWPNPDPKLYEIHALETHLRGGDGGLGLRWRVPERACYDWSQPGVVQSRWSTPTRSSRAAAGLSGVSPAITRRWCWPAGPTDCCPVRGEHKLTPVPTIESGPPIRPCRALEGPREFRRDAPHVVGVETMSLRTSAAGLSRG
jgi:hypothetical protein